ncbi:unnamed protein product [Mytilus coruscus]|uniref:Uncharacterized protein n=1 Tax=Mytilus coruscus TaxID=42192 RepID=A0A6J8BAQ3_MYTCO|nr:unnamed protein product [Mytilus coruscus]
MNNIVLIALFDKSMKKPFSIFLPALALANNLTALCIYGLEPVFALLYHPIGRANNVSHQTDQLDLIYGSQFNSFEEIQTFETLDYPFCAMHYYSTQLVDMFYFVSTDDIKLFMNGLYLEIYAIYKDNLNSNQEKLFKHLFEETSNTTMEPVKTPYAFKTFKVATCYSLFDLRSKFYKVDGWTIGKIFGGVFQLHEKVHDFFAPELAGSDIKFHSIQ